ncbi:MAG: hypothetical protein IH999_03600 [Proteobacteria bacterium]|nr:hypothetical protein [Pseudomonadota bacterium]
MERWIIILGGFEIVGGGIVTAYPEFLPQWIGFVAIAIGVLTISYGVWGTDRPRPAYYGSPLRNAWLWNWNVRISASAILPLSRLVPLRRAAQIAYEKTRGSAAAMMAERPIGQELPNPLTWFANALTGKNNQEIALYGMRPHSTKLEIVPPDLLKSCGFSNDVDALIEHTSRRIQYQNLHMKKADLGRRIRDIRSWR